MSSVLKKADKLNLSLSTSHSQQFILELMSALRVCVEKMQPGTDSI